MTIQTITQTQTLAATILTNGGTTGLYGPAGSGKSYALRGIAAEALAAGREVIAIALVWGASFEGARVITRASEAVRFLHGAMDRYRAAGAEVGTVGPVILVEEFGATAEKYPEVAELIRELAWQRSRAITTVIATQRPDASVLIQGQSVVYLARPGFPGFPVSTEAIAMAFGAQRGEAASDLLVEASAQGVHGHAVASFLGHAPEALRFNDGEVSEAVPF